MTWRPGGFPTVIAGLALSPRPGILGIFPGCSAEVGLPVKELQVVPKNREPRSERPSAKGVGMNSPGQGGPQGTKVPSQTMLTSGPGDTQRCPSRTVSPNPRRGQVTGHRTQDRDGSHRAFVWEGALEISSFQKTK